MIGGLYNTTSLLIEPTRALGEFLRAADMGAMPASSLRSVGGQTGSAKGLDAAPVPDRLPTGIPHFIPVVVKMRETKAAETAEVDRAKEARASREALLAERAGQSEDETRPVVSTEEAEPEVETKAMPVATAPETGETVGVYMTSVEPTKAPETSLDTFI